MRGLIYAFGMVAVMDYAADGQMDLFQHTVSEAGDAFWNVTEGVIEGTGYVIRRVGGEIAQSTSPQTTAPSP